MKICLPAIACVLMQLNAAAQQDTLPARVYHIADIAVSKDSSRDRLQIIDAPTSVLQHMDVHLTTLEPGMAAHPPHTHADEEELLIVKEGSVRVTINGKSKVLLPGGLAYSLPGDEHGAVNAGRGKAVYYIVKYKTKIPLDAARGQSAGGSVNMDWGEPAVEKTDRGERRQFFNRPTALFSKFDMHVTTLGQGAVSHLPHTHRQEEIIIVKSGHVAMHIADKFYPAGPGDVVFLCTGVPHALENRGDGPCTYYAFQWQ